MIQARNAFRPRKHLRTRASFMKSSNLIVLVLFCLLLAACSSSTGTSTGSGSDATTATTSPIQQTSNPATTTSSPSTPEAALATTSASNGYAVKVYFSKFPDSLNSFNAVFPVDRTSPTSAVATFSLQLLLAGPTLSERGSGYFTEFNSILTGPSSCSAPHPTGGPDFTLTLNMKGTKASPGTATVQLCRDSQSPGIGADARILAEINATLKQFASIKNVVVLTRAGQCFGDESGQNICLK